VNTKEFYKGKKFHYNQTFVISNYLEEIVTKYSTHIAITCGKEQVDYQTLDRYANQLAHYLITSKKIIPGDFIGVYFTPSIDLIIAILAIVKSGAAYVPLDLTYPEKIIDYIVKNSNPKIILSNISHELMRDNILNIHDIDLNDYSGIKPSIQLSPENPLYVIYTSGSTGEPKGVLIPHRAAINHMLWMKNEFQFDVSDKILLKTPLTFDPSVWEIFVPLFTGAELVIAPAGSHIDTYLLLNTIVQHQVTTIQLVPAILQKLLNHPDISLCSSLKSVFVGGESLQNKTKELFFKKLQCSLINLYGPTETTIDITYHKIKNTPEEIEKNYIGKPIYNTELCVLDENLNMCSVNEEGELFVSGDCVGLGYLNSPTITKNSFLPHPFLQNKIIYKTGDIVRVNEQGIIEYIARKDNQIKINGVRVELAAVISKVMEQENVANCLITKNNNNEGTYSYLICYIIPETGKAVDITQIKNILSYFFPKSVIPKEYYLIDEIPFLPNGKIDNSKLEKESEFFRNKKITTATTKEQIQEDLMGMCQHFIQSHTANINDDLHENGIDSLSCLILIEQIEKKYHIDLLVHEILSHKTINALSGLIINKITRIDSDGKSNNSTIITLKESGNKTPLFLVHPIGGTVFWYNNIAKYFDKDRPLYGIQDPGIESSDYFFANIEEMANYYYTHIKNIQPKGPYIIGGASFGATIAIEICRHMKKKDVICIPVLDGWGVYPEELRDENYFRESMIKQQKDWQTKFGVYGYNEFTKIFATQTHRLELLYKYRMRKIKHNILLFKSKNIMDIFEPIDSYDNNWSKYAQNKLDIIIAEGNHETMFHNPNVKTLAHNLTTLLDKQKK
jgi:amino acid adenylation domain-containing protein